jgi:hypothetical protein
MVLVSKEVVINKDQFFPELELTLRLPFTIVDNTGSDEVKEEVARLIGKQVYSVLESVVNDN